MKCFLILDENEQYVDSYTKLMFAVTTIRTTHAGHTVSVEETGNGVWTVTVETLTTPLIYFIRSIEPKERPDHL